MVASSNVSTVRYPYPLAPDLDPRDEALEDPTLLRRLQVPPAPGLLKLISRAQELQEIFTRGGRPISEMAEAAGVSNSYFTRMLRLSFLAPDITRAILHGHQPAELTARKLMADTRTPIDWDEQRAGLGFI